MKSKTFGKKLTLNKKTVADLTIGRMMNVHGGGPSPYTKFCVNTVENCPTGVCTQGCPTECTCGSGDPLCPCFSGIVE